jgi:phage shock protein B
MEIGESVLAVVAVVMALAIPLAVILLPAIVILGSIWLLRKPARSAKQEAEETRLIQEIHHGLGRMEQRIETLETLVLGEGAHHEEHAHRSGKGAL